MTDQERPMIVFDPDNRQTWPPPLEYGNPESITVVGITKEGKRAWAFFQYGSRTWVWLLSYSQAPEIVGWKYLNT